VLYQEVHLLVNNINKNKHSISKMRFIIVFTKSGYYILLSPLDIPLSIFTSCFPTKTLNVFHFSYIRPTSHATHIVTDLIHVILFGHMYKLQSFSLGVFLFPPIICSSLTDPSTFISNRISNTLNVCSSVSVRDHILHPYKTTGKI